jgi:hypothetical protein
MRSGAVRAPARWVPSPLALPLGLVLGLALALVLACGAPAGAQQEPTTLPLPEVSVPHIIPRPNSGHAPEDAGDRGGALQLGLLGLVVVALAGGGLHVVRQSRRARGL